MFLRHLIIFSELGFSYSGIVTCLSNDVYLKLENGDGRKKREENTRKDNYRPVNRDIENLYMMLANRI